MVLFIIYMVLSIVYYYVIFLSILYIYYIVLNDLQKCSSLPRHGVKIQLLNPPLRKSRIIDENEGKTRVVQDGAEQTHV